MSVKGTSNNSSRISNHDQSSQPDKVNKKGVFLDKPLEKAELGSDDVYVARGQNSNDMASYKGEKITDGVSSEHIAYEDARKRIERFFVGTWELQPSERRISVLAGLPEGEIKKNLPDIETLDTSNSPVHAMGSKFEQYHQELDKLKDNFGGSPNYFGGRPKLRRGKKWFGLSVDTVSVLVSKALKKKWSPRPLFHALGKYLGLGASGLTRYEYISLALQSAEKIKKHLPEIQARLVSNEGAFAFFNKKTGLTFHERLNKPEVLASSLSDYLELLEKHMDHAIINDCLQDFFDEAILDVDVCFEARMSRLLAYSASHTLDGSDIISLDSIADYNSDSSLEQVLNEEIKVIVLSGVESDSIDYDTVYDHLVNKKRLLGKSFKGGYCDSSEFAQMMGEEIDRKEVIITEDFLRKYLDYAENILCLF